MTTLSYIYIGISVCLIYLFFLLFQKRYRLLIPSVIHSLTWLITLSLMALELNDVLGKGAQNIHYEKVAPYILYMMISATIGFVLAHLMTESVSINPKKYELLPINVVNNLLISFRWLPYLCLFCGICLLFFIISVGGINSLGDYRLVAVTVKKVGFFSIIQRISGHITVLGTFYIGFLAYKHAINGLNIKEFLKITLMYGSIGISGGGRLWILLAILPYAIIYLLVQKKLNYVGIKRDLKNILMILIAAVSLFSVIGMFRNDTNRVAEDGTKRFFDKFLYYTDGPKMTNIVLSKYPDGSFNLEYGKAEFLSKYFKSKMQERFRDDISYDPGLSVTAKSSIYLLYFDFGYWGGIFMWGIICMIVEYLAIRLMKTVNIVGILFFLLLTLLYFQSPIFEVFNVYTPYFYWLILIYIFRSLIFKSVLGIKPYL